MTTQILMRQGVLEPTSIVLFYHIDRVYIIRNVRIGCHRHSAPNVSTCNHMSILSTTFHNLNQWCKNCGRRSLEWSPNLTTCHRIGSKFFLRYSGDKSNLILHNVTQFSHKIYIEVKLNLQKQYFLWWRGICNISIIGNFRYMRVQFHCFHVCWEHYYDSRAYQFTFFFVWALPPTNNVC